MNRSSYKPSNLAFDISVEPFSPGLFPLDLLLSETYKFSSCSAGKLLDGRSIVQLGGGSSGNGTPPGGIIRLAEVISPGDLGGAGIDVAEEKFTS